MKINNEIIILEGICGQGNCYLAKLKKLLSEKNIDISVKLETDPIKIEEYGVIFICPTSKFCPRCSGTPENILRKGIKSPCFIAKIGSRLYHSPFIEEKIELSLDRLMEILNQESYTSY